jgi:hypothetical protein
MEEKWPFFSGNVFGGEEVGEVIKYKIAKL